MYVNRSIGCDFRPVRMMKSIQNVFAYTLLETMLCVLSAVAAVVEHSGVDQQLIWLFVSDLSIGFRTWNFVRTLRRINWFENQNKQISDSRRAHNIFPRIARNLLLATQSIVPTAVECSSFPNVKTSNWEYCDEKHVFLYVNFYRLKINWAANVSDLFGASGAQEFGHIWSVCSDCGGYQVSPHSTRIDNMHIETKIITNFRWINSNNNINWQFSVAAMAVAATVSRSAIDWLKQKRKTTVFFCTSSSSKLKTRKSVRICVKARNVGILRNEQCQRQNEICYQRLLGQTTKTTKKKRFVLIFGFRIFQHAIDGVPERKRNEKSDFSNT